MLTFERIRKNKKKLVSLTTLAESEFLELCIYFKVQHDLYFSKKNLLGKNRKRTFKFKENSTFKCVEDMLLFLLIYLKTYPLQEVYAAQNDMTQPQVANWTKLLKTFLRKGLKECGCLPARNKTGFKELLKTNKVVFQDATERQINRPIVDEIQREFYSGKKNSIQ